MDKTKSAIKDFVSKAGHKDTTVHETINPAVKHETVKPTRHEEVNTAVDKEVHKDHYHHTVQPVKDREILPEKHHHNVAPVETREFEHRNPEHIKHAIAGENQKHRDERVVHETARTETHAPTVAGEHVHHHLHETIQPVVEKEVVQPSVVHTTIPVKEVHHEAKHHSSSTLPPISMEEYRHKGGALGGRDERFDAFEGEPRDIASGHYVRDHKHNSGYDEKHPPKGVYHGDIEPLSGVSNHTTHGRENQHLHKDVAPGATGAAGTGRAEHGHPGETRRENPGLLNKLNPKTDTDRDGKAGFMD